LFNLSGICHKIFIKKSPYFNLAAKVRDTVKKDNNDWRIISPFFALKPVFDFLIFCGRIRGRKRDVFKKKLQLFIDLL